ncbi:hypothetical protein SAMN05216352_10694 [Alteribacillus bidgolensis]|uniref:Uncharacterized protein n=1 Tax=Alteribacillus bidgolensis TaxID=930129 RepID=A0A1G8J8V4_9BACI|nr:hypothetical protein SAMN05216352_10694 [Alteribacillus bidgolensis]
MKLAKRGLQDIFIANEIVGKSKINRIKSLSKTIKPKIVGLQAKKEDQT